jgi:hypothetical protein
MATIYSIPDSVKAPKLDFNDIDAWQEDEKRFINEMVAFVKDYHPEGGEHVGKTIKFPAADSYAVYMVASMKPLQLVHLPVGDAWQYPMAHRLKRKDVELMIQQQESLDKMVEENRLRQLAKKI